MTEQNSKDDGSIQLNEATLELLFRAALIGSDNVEAHSDNRRDAHLDANVLAHARSAGNNLDT